MKSLKRNVLASPVLGLYSLKRNLKKIVVWF